MIKLSKRLVQVADFVNDGAKIVDIGCDHGLTDIYILQTKKDVSIIASDINEKALSNAITNIKKYKLENKISTIVSDGLSEIDTDNIDTIKFNGNLPILLIDLLNDLKIVSSKSEGRRLIEQNGISVNQEKENNIDRIITKDDFKDGFIIIQKGKKVFLKVMFE